MSELNENQKLAEALRDSGIGDWKDPIYHVVYSRALFRCEYCDFDLMSSLSAYLGFWQLDHILPKAKYPKIGGPKYYKYRQTGTDFLNLALSCVACNSLKSDFDPGEAFVDRTASDVTPELRHKLVDRARTHVARLRQQQDHNFLAVVELLKTHS